MSVPQNADELFQLVRKSGLVDEQKLSAFTSAHQRDGLLREDAKKIILAMVREGIITSFQGEQYLLGKWRGFTLGKYKLLERIGVGGMGQIFLCEHTFMRRRMAVKVLPPSKAEDPVSLGRFYREARVAAGLDHANIVRTFDIDQDGPLHFLVMEYVDGTSLAEIVKKFGPINVVRACHYLRQACMGLQYAHTAGMIHRDIKPGNIMVDRGGTAKLLDMGLARLHQDEADQLTLKYDDRNVLGTADYVAPEQTRDSRNIDIRADIYGMGATFYYVLTGQPPFPDTTIAEKLIAHQTKKPRPVREIRPEIPAGVSKIIDRMLAKDPKERYQTPQEVVDALEIWTQQPIEAPPEAEMPKLSLAAMDPVYAAGTQLVPAAHAREVGTVRPEEPAPLRSAASTVQLPDVAAAAVDEGRTVPVPPPRPVPLSGSVVDLISPIGSRPAPRLSSAGVTETQQMPAAADPTPQPAPRPAAATGAETPRLNGSHLGQSASKSNPLPGSQHGRLPGSQVGRLPGSHPGRSVLPPLRPSAQGTTKPLPPQGATPSAPPVSPPSAHPAIELPKLRSFQGVAMSYASVEATPATPARVAAAEKPQAAEAEPARPMSVEGFRAPMPAAAPARPAVVVAAPPRPTAPPAAPPAAPPRVSPALQAPAAPAPVGPPRLLPFGAPPPTAAAPAAPPRFAPIGAPPGPAAPTRLAPIAPPAPAAVGQPRVAPAVPAPVPSRPPAFAPPAPGAASAKPAYRPPTHMPFFDQPIMPDRASFAVRLTRWILLAMISGIIGAGLGIAGWYQFLRPGE